jgi:hypothetical protein
MRDLIDDHDGVYAPLPGFIPYRIDLATAYREATRAAEDAEFRETVARYILSAALDACMLEREFPRLRQVVQTLLRRGAAGDEMVGFVILCGARDYFERLGDEYGLPHHEVDALARMFLSVLRQSALAGVAPSAEVYAAIERFQEAYRVALRRETYPFAGCEAVCPAKVCLYRHNVRRFVRDDRLDRNYRKALAESSGEERWAKLHGIGGTVVRRVVADAAATTAKAQIAGCFAVQKSQDIKTIDFALRVKIRENTVLKSVTEQ